MASSLMNFAVATTGLASLGLAQWQNLPNFADISVQDLINNVTEEDSGKKNNCFQVSQIKGRSDFTTDYVSDLSRLKEQYQEDMQMRKIRLCGSFYDFQGIQGWLENGLYQIQLKTIGSDFQCEDYELPTGSYIAKVLLTYSNSGIKYIKVSTEKGVNYDRGEYKDYDEAFVVEFDQYEPLSGFVGYESAGKITGIGFYRYMCGAKPVDLDPTDPDSPDGGSGTGTGDGTGEGTGGEGSGEGNSGTGDGSTDDGEGNALDPEGSREEQELMQKNGLITVQQEEQSNLTTILIILLCILVPLILVLICVVYMFRRNRVNSIQTATIRRASSIRRMEEKMEAKGHDIFGSEKQQLGDRSHLPMLSGPTDDVDKVMMNHNAGAVINQVPTDEQIKELMKGKTAGEKKNLLKEIEKARQAKIHMTYLLEQQKLRADEKWAVRNVEERTAVLNLYRSSNDAMEDQNNMQKLQQDMESPVGAAAQPDQNQIVEENNNEGDFDYDDQKEQGHVPQVIAPEDDATEAYVHFPPIPGYNDNSQQQPMQQEQEQEPQYNNGEAPQESGRNGNNAQKQQNNDSEEFDFEL